MFKKWVILFIILILFTGNAFSQEQENEHKYNKGNVLLGFEIGLGLTQNIFPSFFKLFFEEEVQKGNYSMFNEVGLNYNIYFSNYLSLSTGFLFRPEMYLLLDNDLEEKRFIDIAEVGIFFIIPILFHVNILHAEWLYLGSGVKLHAPMITLLNNEFFFSIPLELGFDFIKPGKGGSRFILKVIPEFHQNGITWPFGMSYQYNWRIN